MKIRDWRRLTDYWDKHPPACELLELQATGRQLAPPARVPTEADMRDLAAMVEGA